MVARKTVMTIMTRRALTMTRSIFFKNRSIKTPLHLADGQTSGAIIGAGTWVGNQDLTIYTLCITSINTMVYAFLGTLSGMLTAKLFSRKAKGYITDQPVQEPPES
jgi:hypothetical protein